MAVVSGSGKKNVVSDRSTSGNRSVAGARAGGVGKGASSGAGAALSAAGEGERLPEASELRGSKPEGPSTGPREVEALIGLMDPNRYALKETLEKLFAFLDLRIPFGGEIHRVSTRRLKSRPYDTLKAEAPYRAILNRGAHWNPHHNSYLSIIAPECYLLNDMVSFFAIDKNTSYGQMARLGLHIPPTVAIPQYDYSELKSDPKVTQELMFEDFELFDLRECGDAVGYPAYLKPQSGGGWVGVERVENHDELLAAFARSGDKPMNLQKAVEFREFVRAVGVGPQVIPMHYNPGAELSHERYLRSPTRAVDHFFLTPAETDEITKITRVINAFYNWDHNSCEALIDHRGTISPIDFANAYPDSSPVSLHYYFPELVKAKARWLTFVAVTRRKKPIFGQEWNEFFEIRAEAERTGMGYHEKLERYHQVALKHFAYDEFEHFCQTSLPDFDEQCYDFFGSDTFSAILEQEVGYYFKLPAERPLKVQHYLGIHNFWMHCELQRIRARTRLR